MIIVALLIGAILIVAAIRNSQGALFTALGTDAPGFIVWAAALFALGAIGFIPGLRPVSRGLLGLVLLVLILNNYQKILAGFQNAWQNPGAGGGAASTSAPAALAPGGGSFGGGGASGSWDPSALINDAVNSAQTSSEAA